MRTAAKRLVFGPIFDVASLGISALACKRCKPNISASARKILSHTQGQSVAAFKDPSFQDRIASAGKAKQKALNQLKAKPSVNEGVMAERRQAWEAREQTLSGERASKTKANAAAKAEKASIKAAELAEAKAAAALKAARLKPASEADMKAARDARYAARKTRGR